MLKIPWVDGSGEITEDEINGIIERAKDAVAGVGRVGGRGERKVRMVED